MSLTGADLVQIFVTQSTHPLVVFNAPEALRQKANTYWTTESAAMRERMITKFRREVPHGEVIVMEETGTCLFKDRDADVVRHMNAFYGQILT
jgi:acyl-coenzyme A synthetase/AMP-(fatty) acid ligase